MSEQHNPRPDMVAEAPVGHYPGANALSQQKHWDRATRELVLDRVYNVPPIRFFNPQEVETLQAAIDILLPQDDRPPEERVPIINYIDEGQHKGETPGYRHEDMPDEHSAWRWGLEGIDQTSQALFGRRFVALGPAERRQVLERVRRGEASGEIWRRMPAQRFFNSTLMAAIISSYYSHPHAWDEIGYGGPAYPRGYYGLNQGAREHWEVEERR